MSYRGREKEVKLITSSEDLDQVTSLLEDLFSQEIDSRNLGLSADKFWRAPEDSRVDFVRTRDMTVATQVTVKGRDKQDGGVDRIEIEFLSTTPAKEIHSFFNSLLGKSVGELTKNYRVFILENEQTTLSIYIVNNTEPALDKVIVEVEARSLERVLELEIAVQMGLDIHGIQVMRAPGSLFEMFISREVTVSTEFPPW